MRFYSIFDKCWCVCKMGGAFLKGRILFTFSYIQLLHTVRCVFVFIIPSFFSITLKVSSHCVFPVLFKYKDC